MSLYYCKEILARQEYLWQEKITHKFKEIMEWLVRWCHLKLLGENLKMLAIAPI